MSVTRSGVGTAHRMSESMTAVTWLARSPRRLALATAVAAWLLALLADQVGAWQRLDLAAYDLMLGLQPQAPVPALTLVTIDEADIRALNTWPVPDRVLARGLANALEHRPRVLAVDLYRDFPIAGGPLDAPDLDALLREHPNIVFPMFLGQGPDRVHPPAVLAPDGPQVGFADLVLDADGTVRRGLLYADDGRTFYRAMALQIVRQALRPEGLGERNEGEHVALGHSTIPRLAPDAGGYVDADAAGYQFMLDFAGALREVRRYSFQDLLAGRVARADIEDRIVLLGVIAPSIKDFFRVARGTDSLPEGTAIAGLMPGVFVHAHIIDQLLRLARGESAPLRLVPGWLEQLWVLGWALAGAAWGSRSRRVLPLLGSAGLGVALVAAAHYGLFRAGYWIPGGVAPLVALLAAMSVVVAESIGRARRQEARARNLFVSQVGPEIARWLEREAQSGDGRLPPLDLTVTVFFSDLVGFSSVMESKGARSSIDGLNECMATVRRVIMAHEGVVLQYFGDAIFAVFGAPVPQSSSAAIARDATHAVRCAMAVNTELSRLNAEWKRRGWLAAGASEGLGMRIGINTGPVVAGSIGEAQFWRYTLFGPTVNVAARMETLEKERFRPEPLTTPCRVLITEATRVLLPDDIPLQALGEFKVRNIPQPVRVHEVILSGER